MKNNLIVILLLVLIGVMAGLGLLFGITNAVQVAMTPLVERVNETAANQKNIEQKLNAISASLANLDRRLKQAPQPAAKPQQQPPSEDMNKVYDIPVGLSVIVGKKDAPVTIVQFTDLQCPFCSRFYAPIKEVLKAYPDKVRFVIKSFPLAFHANARPAAKLSFAAAEQGKYIEMVEALLASGADVSEAKIKEYAQSLGLNYAKLTATLKAKDAEFDLQIAEEMKLGEKVDVHGTPTFFLNGKKTSARDFNTFKQEIDKILAK